MLNTVKIIFGILGILFALGSDRLKMPVLMYSGLACFGLMAITIGWEAILTREIRLGSRRGGSRQTYTGIPAVMQGIQFNVIGLFLIGISFTIYFTEQNILDREVFMQFVRRPGIPLVAIGLLLLLQSAIVLIGYREQKQGPGWVVTLNLLLSRLYPGLILLALGVGAIGLGLFEIAAPEAFDASGGGFLETLYAE